MKSLVSRLAIAASLCVAGASHATPRDLWEFVTQTDYHQLDMWVSSSAEEKGFYATSVAMGTPNPEPNMETRFDVQSRRYAEHLNISHRTAIESDGVVYDLRGTSESEFAAVRVSNETQGIETYGVILITTTTVTMTPRTDPGGRASPFTIVGNYIHPIAWSETASGADDALAAATDGRTSPLPLPEPFSFPDRTILRPQSPDDRPTPGSLPGPLADPDDAWTPQTISCWDQFQADKTAALNSLGADLAKCERGDVPTAVGAATTIGGAVIGGFTGGAKLGCFFGIPGVVVGGVIGAVGGAAAFVGADQFSQYRCRQAAQASYGVRRDAGIGNYLNCLENNGIDVPQW